MEIYNLILTKFKRIYYQNKKKFYLYTVPVLIIAVISATLVDVYMQNSYWTNMLKSVFVAVASSVNVILYMTLSNEKARMIREDRPEYLTTKEKLSHKQRKNLSLIVAVVLLTLHLSLFRPDSNIYSISSIVVISVLLYLPLFMSKTVYENNLEEQGIRDVRDIDNELKDLDKEIEKSMSNKEWL